MSTTYHVLAASDFLQDWSNTGLITANDNWYGVPSIVGYRGDGLCFLHRRQSADRDRARSAAVDVNANQTDPHLHHRRRGGISRSPIRPWRCRARAPPMRRIWCCIWMRPAARTCTLSFNARELDGRQRRPADRRAVPDRRQRQLDQCAGAATSPMPRTAPASVTAERCDAAGRGERRARICRSGSSPPMPSAATTGSASTTSR